MARFEDVLAAIANWRKENKITIAEVAEKMGDQYDSIKDLLRGRKKIFSEERRIKLYEVTHLPILKESIEPLERTYKKSNEQKVLTTKNLPEVKDVAIYRTLDSIVAILNNIENDFRNIKITLTQQFQNNASQFLNNYRPSHKERMQIVETAIDILVEQVDYYKTAPQQERKELVKYLDDLGEVERWGYVVNIIDKIHQPGNTPDTFCRTFNSPKKFNKRK
ncbi:hypothetical protein HYV49_02730 [Candidatus Pacearchaeota archaeon]|nr:hypothetical protein [Candidatus Pacearchaeota archaeon]